MPSTAPAKKTHASKSNGGGFLSVSTSKKTKSKPRNSPEKGKPSGSSNATIETPPPSIDDEDDSEVRELEDALDRAEIRLSQAKDTIRHQDRDLEIQIKNSSHWERECERIMREYDRMKREYDRMKQVNDQLAEKNKQLVEKNNQLENKIDSLRGKIDDKDHIIAIKDETIRTKSQDIKKSEQDKKDAYGDIKILSEEVDRLKEIKAILGEKLDLVHRDLDRETFRQSRPNPFERRDFPLR